MSMQRCDSAFPIILTGVGSYNDISMSDYAQEQYEIHHEWIQNGSNLTHLFKEHYWSNTTFLSE